ncbi:MAG: SH3 domain-containing protein [Rhizobiaceae bacterium]|nr:SH3 domain-containing protein [Rhizobiaceae bacterium]
MSIPAGETRRPRIQWHDDGSSPRARNVIFDDASPYKALGLAVALGILSIVAVVGVIQFQRQGMWSDVGSSIVEEARATPAEAVVADAKPDPAITKPAAVDVPAAAANTTSISAADTAARAEPAAIVETAEALVRSVGAELSVPASTDAQAKVEAIRADEIEAAALEPLTTGDPRWQMVETASIANEPETESPDIAELLAFAPVPEPAPRKKQQTALAAMQARPEPSEVRPEKVSARTTGLSLAKIRSSVFLRARPADGSKVLVTIPRGTNVQVDPGCRHWCAVTYDGKRGFVYKSFLSR